ncbi:hypothetical protein OG905_01580 [Streptomyces sp. NBC_00322]|uniref:hypothetical protein n=1 Tax=Streptomyces sp. NBC_00322 TaxID=2975712 RepID=UPI002E297318|nr:hypothetical protein [Streptomyces sp. NBC_00322]
MQTNASFWDSPVFDGIDDDDVEAATAAFGTVDVVAKGRAAGDAGFGLLSWQGALRCTVSDVAAVPGALRPSAAERTTSGRFTQMLTVHHPEAAGSRSASGPQRLSQNRNSCRKGLNIKLTARTLINAPTRKGR